MAKLRRSPAEDVAIIQIPSCCLEFAAGAS
jgi:hypothetical protein